MLDSSILSRQSKGIKTHRVKHIIALHPLEPGMNIRGSHGIPMTDMKITRGIREHGQGIPLGLGALLSNLIQLILSPLLLPLFFYFLRVILNYHLLLQLNKSPPPQTDDSEEPP
jgi:hypothetical protein